MSDRKDRMIWDEGDTNISQCASCINWAGDGICLAFPNGVPEVILDNEHDHTKPFPGDHGILFELTPLETPEAT